MKYAKVASEHHNKAHLRRIMPYLKAYSSATKGCNRNDLQKISPHGHGHKSELELLCCWTSWSKFTKIEIESKTLITTEFGGKKSELNAF